MWPENRKDVRFTHSAVKSEDHSERTSLEASEWSERYSPTGEGWTSPGGTSIVGGHVVVSIEKRS